MQNFFKAQWISHHKPYTWMGYTYYTCSNCNYGEQEKNQIITNYCPSCGAYMYVKENIERKKNMDTTRIKYYIYDIDEHELVAEVYDPYYLGIVVEGFGRNEINMQIQPVVVDTEDCKSDE